MQNSVHTWSTFDYSMNLRSRGNVAGFLRTEAKLSIAFLELTSCHSTIHVRLYLRLHIRHESAWASIPIIKDYRVFDSERRFLAFRSGFHRVYHQRDICQLSHEMTSPSKRIFTRYRQNYIFDNMERNHGRGFGQLRWSMAWPKLNLTKMIIYHLAAPIWNLDNISASR
jgi:hypothetical protein